MNFEENEYRQNSDIESIGVFSEEKRKENISRIKEILRNNLHSCDLLFCLFYSSLNSNKVNRCFKPFPPGFDDRNFNTIHDLRKLCSTLPNLKHVMSNPEDLSTEVIALLEWLFSRKNQPYLQIADVNTFCIPNEVNISLQPNYIFEVVYPCNIQHTWSTLKKKHKVIHALHGSQLENFYSIVRFGLQQQFSDDKSQLFGHGTYLSTEFNVSVIFAPFSINWPKSTLGNKLSILALCEVLDVKDKVMRKDSKSVKRSTNAGGIGGELPDKYLVVTDNEAVKVKYLLIYRKRESTFHSWAYQNIVPIMLTLYFIMLCLIGSYRNISLTCTRIWNRYLRRYFSQ